MPRKVKPPVLESENAALRKTIVSQARQIASLFQALQESQAQRAVQLFELAALQRYHKKRKKK